MSLLSCGGGVDVGGAVEGGSGSGRDRDAEKQLSPAYRRRCPSSLHPRIRRASPPPAPPLQPPPPLARLGPPPPCHYIRETFKASSVHDDSILFWLPLRPRQPRRQGAKPTSARMTSSCPSIHINFGRVRLEVRLNEEMYPPNRGLRCNVSATRMEMLGLGTDRLMGRGCGDLPPLLLGTWEWEGGGLGEQQRAGRGWRRRATTMTAGNGGGSAGWRRTAAEDDCDSGGGR